MAADLTAATEVPDDLDALVRTAAGSMAGYPADLPAITRRGAEKRRRYIAGMAGGVAALAVVALAVPAVIGVSRSPSRTTSQPSPAGPLIRYPQRQLLPNVEGFGMEPSCGTGEVLPDGTLGWLPSPPPLNQETCIRSVGPDPDAGGAIVGQNEGNDPEDSTPLPDGRIVWWLWSDTISIKYAPSQKSMFRVQAADGTYGPLRDVDTGQPLGADERSAYVLSGHDVVSYDLVTGQRQTRFALQAADPTQVRHLTDVDVAGGRLVLARPDCTLRVLDLVTGRTVADHSLGPVGCHPAPSPSPCRSGRSSSIKGDLRYSIETYACGNRPAAVFLAAIRLSPDGKRLAVLYTAGQTPRAAVLDLDSGAVLADAPLPQAGLKLGDPVAPASLAWLAPGSVRVAWEQRPASAKQGQWFQEKDILRLFTLKVPG